MKGKAFRLFPLLAAALCLSGGGCRRAVVELPALPTREPTAIADRQARSASEPAYDIVTLAEPDAVQAIDHPEFWTAEEADRRYAPQEKVIGVAGDGEARAYSVPFLSRHQVVNDSLTGLPIAVTWSPLCYTTMVYVRPGIDGRELDFGVSGKVVMGCFLMYDRQSDSLWSQVLGEAVWGPLRGRKLERLPAVLTTWGAWRAAHPDTEALATSGDPTDPYATYYTSPDAGARGAAVRDDRLPRKALVLGALVDDQPTAYSMEALANAVVSNETVGERGMLAVRDPATGTAFAFDREVNGRRLTFRRDTDAEGGLALVDAETGSRWSPWTGQASEGPLFGRGLTPLPATTAFWFAWRDHYPDTIVYSGDG